MLVHALSNLPSLYVDEAVVTQIDAIIPQCNLSQLNRFTIDLLKWMKHQKPNQKSYSGPYGSLLQKINSCAFQRLEEINNLDLLLKEFRYIHGKWFQEVLLEKTIVTLHQLRDQITWSNVVKFASFLLGTNYRCTLLLDRIAAVTTEHIDQVQLISCISLENDEMSHAQRGKGCNRAAIEHLLYTLKVQLWHTNWVSGPLLVMGKTWAWCPKNMIC